MKLLNRRKMGQRIISLALVVLFSISCGTSASGPTATPIPPTATSIPPTATPNPCPTLAPVSTAAEQLLPLQAIARDKVSFQLADYVVPKNTGDTLLVVYFEGFEKTGVPLQEMNWLLQDEACNTSAPIGFGFPIAEEPIVLMGTLRGGSIYPVADGSNPLLALVFVMPRETTTVTLLGPGRQEHRLSLASDWVPGSEHILLNLESDGRIDWLAEGDNWKREP